MSNLKSVIARHAVELREAKRLNATVNCVIDQINYLGGTDDPVFIQHLFLNPNDSLSKKFYALSCEPNGDTSLSIFIKENQTTARELKKAIIADPHGFFFKDVAAELIFHFRAKEIESWDETATA